MQWSWSARNEDTKTVVVTLWQDEFKRLDNRLVYERGPAWVEGVRRRPGHTELMENLRWAIDHCDGYLKVIVAIAKDKNAIPRSISECFPSKIQLRVARLNETTGEFALESTTI